MGSGGQLRKLVNSSREQGSKVSNWTEKKLIGYLQIQEQPYSVAGSSHAESDSLKGCRR